MYKVLIIDDEEAIREGLVKTIDWEDMSCEIVGEAEDGDEGLAMISAFKPDIVFTDIRMPGMDGLAMISKIKELNYECKIIILTGFRDFEYAQEAVRLGAFRFILKPSKTEEIKLAIADAIKEVRKLKTKEDTFNNMKKKIKEYYGLESGNKPEKSSGAGDEKVSVESKNASYLVNRALSYIKLNYKNDLDLKSVADKLFISTWYLSKLLSKETGSTFVDILNEVRVEEAKKLLMDPKYKIYEVAEQVGFNDVPYFTKLFKKVTGVTPMDYRNNK